MWHLLFILDMDKDSTSARWYAQNVFQAFLGCIHLLNTCKYCGNTHEYWANTWIMCLHASVLLVSVVTILPSFQAILTNFRALDLVIAMEWTSNIDTYKNSFQNCLKTNEYWDNICKYCTSRWTYFTSIGSILISITTILLGIEQVNIPLDVKKLNLNLSINISFTTERSVLLH